MEKEEYSKLIEALNIRVDECHKYLDEIKTTDDLKNVSIARALEIRDFCIKEVDLQTKVLMCDLYHIIGMGNLSAVQMNLFIKLIKDYAHFRPDLKALATKLDSISDLPTLPAKTKYKLQVLGDITLHMATRDGESEQVELASIADYTATKAIKVVQNDTATTDIERVSIDNVEVDDNIITIFDVENNTYLKLDALVASMHMGGNSMELYKKIKAGSTYLGTKWKVKAGNAIGVMNASTAPYVNKFIK